MNIIHIMQSQSRLAKATLLLSSQPSCDSTNNSAVGVRGVQKWQPFKFESLLTEVAFKVVHRRKVISGSGAVITWGIYVMVDNNSHDNSSRNLITGHNTTCFCTYNGLIENSAVGRKTYTPEMCLRVVIRQECEK